MHHIRLLRDGMLLDATHLADQSFWDALELYDGPVLASHHNCRALVPGDRQLSDDQIRLLGERNGMIGIVLYNCFLKANYFKGEPKEYVTLTHVIAHIDHICQLLGDADHVGIGSDFDGGIGAADIPFELDSVNDLGKIADALKIHGYEETDIQKIMGANWLRLLQNAFE